MLIALMAGIKKLRYYTFDKAGSDGFRKGLSMFLLLRMPFDVW
jgi:hypothetical protein